METKVPPTAGPCRSLRGTRPSRQVHRIWGVKQTGKAAWKHRVRPEENRMTTTPKRGLATPLIAAAALLVLAHQAGAEPLQITVWHQEQVQSRVDQFQKVIDAFNASQSDYNVVQQVQGWGTIYQKLPPAIQAGVQPDIDFTIPDFTVTIRETGAVQPVDDIVAEIEKKHKFIDQALTPYKDDGKIWAVPLYGMVQLLWYRKDLFKEAGLDPQSPPKTWDEF